MLKDIQKKVQYLRIKVYYGLCPEETEKALHEIEKLLQVAIQTTDNKKTQSNEQIR